MPEQHVSTAPKPFVFVLMPFDSQFDDIYKFGIKGAADDAGAHAERVDEQIYHEGILERIFNQISKADVIVADMTGRNPNVFYEVGYAHALNKVVLLLTQSADDIPFDLKHRPHTVYGGHIEKLRNDLAPRLIWAIGEAKQRSSQSVIERFVVTVFNQEAHEGPLGSATPVIKGQMLARTVLLPFYVRNGSFESSPAISHIYLFAPPDSPIVPYEMKDVYSGTFRFADVSESMSKPIALEAISSDAKESGDGLSVQYRLKATLPILPPRAIERLDVLLMLAEGKVAADLILKLRIHSSTQFHDFYFKMTVTLSMKAQEAEKAAPTEEGEP